MGWERRPNGTKYFYLSYRTTDGKVRKKYCGNGLLAEVEAIRLEGKAKARRCLNEEQQRTAKAETLLKRHVQSTNDITHALMLSIGYTNELSRGWRPLPMIAPQESNAEQADAAAENNKLSFEELAMAARRGDRSVIPALRKILWANPELAKCNGELASQTHIHWIDLIARRDRYYRESLLLKIAELRREMIAETSGTVVEEMLVEQAVSTWLQMYYHEDREATAPAQNMQVGEYRLKKIDSAFNRHMRSLNALASMRAINFTQRMAETMKAAIPEPVAEPHDLLSKAKSRTNGNRIRDAFCRTLEPVPMN